jgi:CheY-specific phosphatase CheX
MESEPAVAAYRASVVQVVDLVFTTMLGLKAKPYPMPWFPSPDIVTAVVHFAGAWHGAVMLECTRRQARTFAHLLMSIEAPPTVDDDVRDALGELANMLAGNLKSVLPPGVVLSMPSVIEGSDYSLQICGKRLVERVPFWSSEDIIGVTMVEILDKPDRETSGGTWAGA